MQHFRQAMLVQYVLTRSHILSLSHRYQSTAYVKGTVNDPTPFPEPNAAHGSNHWAFERGLSVALIPSLLLDSPSTAPRLSSTAHLPSPSSSTLTSVSTASSPTTSTSASSPSPAPSPRGVSAPQLWQPCTACTSSTPVSSSLCSIMQGVVRWTPEADYDIL